MSKPEPSIDQWLKEAKADPKAAQCGMFLTHNGIVRITPGVYYVRTWMNEGELGVGDSIMYVLIGADIRPNCVDALQKLVGKIKNELVVEKEIYA